MSNIINLEMEGIIESNGREFTRLVGGFGEGKPIFTLWQCSELLGQTTREVAQNFERNRDNFDVDVDVIDLKSAITESDSDSKQVVATLSEQLGYHPNKLRATKEWLGFSFSGMMKLVKISTSEESWEIYNGFLEDYFKTKALNEPMSKGIEDQVDILTDQKATLLGKAIMSQDSSERVELMTQVESISNQIANLEKSRNTEEVLNKLKPQLQVAEVLENSKSNLDMNLFAKTLDVRGMGRNNLFKWLRDHSYLNDKNMPYQRYEDYFTVTPVTARNGYTNNKTLLKPKGIEFVVNKLVEGGIVITKSIDEIAEELLAS